MTLFDSCSSKQGHEVTWQEVYELIRGEALRSKTEALRQMLVGYDDLSEEEQRRRDKDVKRIKATWFPALLPAVHCKGGLRRLTEVVDYTGFCHVDFDHLTTEQVGEVKKKLREVPEVLLMHTSMRGHGLHVYFRLEPAPKPDGGRTYQDTYTRGFRQGNAYFAKLAGVPYDTALESPVHLSCPCHDPEVFFNPDAVPFKIDPKRTLAKNGEEGEERKEQKRKSRHRRRGGGTEVTKVERIVEFLQGKALRYDVLSRKVQAFQEGRMENGQWTMDNGQEIMENGQWKMDNEEGRMDKGQVRMENGKWTMDNEEGRMDNGNWSELTERGMNDLFIECSKTLGLNLNYQDFKHVLNSGIVPEVNPLREYILGLPEWDGTDYIGEVAGMVRTENGKWTMENGQLTMDKGQEKMDNGQLTMDNEEGTVDNGQLTMENEGSSVLWQRCFKKWFVAMVASWMRDDVVNHQVLVLIGEQGIFKTTWLDALMPPELVAYRCRQSGARALDKDEQLRATEFGLINMDEIDRMSEQELNALKSLITASDITVRAAYAQTKERRLRVASYVASGNKERFLTDTTGNRRWLPFRVFSIESPFDHPLPYAGMYAQAWALVRQGFNYWFSLADIRAIADHVEEFTTESNEQQLLPVYFSPCKPGTKDAVLLTVAEISAKLTLYGNIRKPLDVRQLGALLKKMGYISKRIASTGKRGYILLENSAEAINAQRRLMALSPADMPIQPIPF